MTDISNKIIVGPLEELEEDDLLLVFRGTKEEIENLDPYGQALGLLLGSLSEAVAKHRKILSHHEALGVLLEEVRELESVVFQQAPMETHRVELIKEFLHVAAVAIRAIGDLKLMDGVKRIEK